MQESPLLFSQRLAVILLDYPAPSSELDVLDVTARRFHCVAYANNEHRRKRLAQLLSADRFKYVTISWDLKS
jgi:hypothetical protein